MISANPSRAVQADARFWDRMARGYAKAKVGDEAGYERTLARTWQFLGQDEEVLELGCGTGSTALRLAPAAGSFLATDLAPEMIKIANEKLSASPQPNLRFEAGTAETVIPPEDGFDIVLGFNYLHLVEDLNQTISSIHELLKPGGLFISKTPSLLAMNSLIRLAVPVLRLVRYAPRNLLWFDDETLLSALRNAGFTIEAVERHGSKKKDARQFIVARRG